MGSFEAAKVLLDRVRVMSLAESLGGVESLISHPATMTHASIPRERQDRLGLTQGMVRISVGIEDAEDLLADLDQALAAV
jgi:cystathionine beta-lyase/cystathionine gamma-synthase